MSFSSYDPSRRYRQRSLQRLTSFFSAFIIFGTVFFVGFWFGRQSSFQSLQSMQQQVKETRAQRDSLQDIVTELGAKAQTANMRLEQLREEYDETVPEGPVEDLIDLVRKQVEQGMDAERLAFVIRSARPPQNCSEPETRRFVISTPAYTGPDSQVVIGENAITIKGTGMSAKNEKGDAEAWYDPTKKVALEFVAADGRIDKKEDVMPIHHSVVSGAREYRFTVEEGARSFAKVTFDSCDYP
jgi:regulator of replication initiation timing